MLMVVRFLISLLVPACARISWWLEPGCFCIQRKVDLIARFLTPDAVTGEEPHHIKGLAEAHAI